MKLKELFVKERKDFFYNAEDEWFFSEENTKKYVLYLLKTKKKYDNPNNSSLLYALGITDIKPNGPVKKTKGGGLMDIDLDFGTKRRHEVFDYIVRTYGEECVASIATFGKMFSKAIIRNIGIALNMPTGPGSDVDIIAKIFPSGEKDFRESVDASPALQEYEKKYPKLFKYAEALSGKPKSVGVHAAGTVVTPVPIMDLFPMGRGTGDKTSVTQWDMYDVEAAGFVKLDLLGLNTIDVMNNTLNLIEKNTGKRLNLSEITLEDKETLNTFAQGKTVGIFQLERRYIQDMCRRLKINCFSDVAALNALLRPGTLHSGMADEYIKRKTGKEKYVCPHPSLKNALKDTFGVLLYQETILFCVRDYAGFTMGESELLRKGIGKKKIEVVEEMKNKFFNGARKLGRPDSVTEVLWNQIDTAKNYCLSLDTVLDTKYGFMELSEIKVGDEILAPKDDDSGDELTTVVAVYDTGIREVYEITLESGKTIRSTLDHKHWCSDDKEHTLKEILENNYSVRIKGDGILYEHVKYSQRIGMLPTRDITVSNNKHRFYANGIVTKNCFNASHSFLYGALVYYTCYLKTHYFKEYMTCLLNGELNSNDPKVDSYLRECRMNRVMILPPDARCGNGEFRIEDGKIRFGLNFIKGVTERCAEELCRLRDKLNSFTDLLMEATSNLNQMSMTNLILAGAFDYMGKDRYFILELYLEIKKRVKLYKEYLKKLNDGVKVKKVLSLEDIYEVEKNFCYVGETMSESDKLKMEYELCSCYITNDPMKCFEQYYNEEGFSDIEDLIEEAEFYNIKNRQCKILAITKNLVVRAVKNGKNIGKSMASMEIFDTTKECEAVIFPDKYAELKDKVFDNAVYILHGSYNGSNFIIRNLELIQKNGE